MDVKNAVALNNGSAEELDAPQDSYIHLSDYFHSNQQVGFNNLINSIDSKENFFGHLGHDDEIRIQRDDNQIKPWSQGTAFMNS